MTQYNDRADKIAKRDAMAIVQQNVMTHTPVFQAEMVMTYSHNGQTHAHMIDFKHSRGLVMRTLIWAARLGIEVTFRKP